MLSQFLLNHHSNQFLKHNNSNIIINIVKTIKTSNAIIYINIILSTVISKYINPKISLKKATPIAKLTIPITAIQIIPIHSKISTNSFFIFF